MKIRSTKTMTVCTKRTCATRRMCLALSISCKIAIGDSPKKMWSGEEYIRAILICRTPGHWSGLLCGMMEYLDVQNLMLSQIARVCIPSDADTYYSLFTLASWGKCNVSIWRIAMYWSISSFMHALHRSTLYCCDRKIGFDVKMERKNGSNGERSYQWRKSNIK